MEWWMWAVYFVLILAFGIWRDRVKRRAVEREEQETIREEPDLVGDAGPKAWVDGKEVEVERMQPESETYSNDGFDFPEDPDFSNRNF